MPPLSLLAQFDRFCADLQHLVARKIVVFLLLLRVFTQRMWLAATDLSKTSSEMNMNFTRGSNDLVAA